MKGFFVFFLCFHAVSPVLHSWKAFYTGSRGLNQFPEFVALNLVDDELMGYFDSNTNRFESKQSWMAENLGQEYEERQTNILQGHVPNFKANVGIAMQRFNQSKGVHINQRMYGCEWDDETEEVKGYYQDGYDGEDFITYDLKTGSWISPTPQAVITKHKWDNDKGFIAQNNNYLTQICPEWLKKYLNYGRSSLMRTVLPSVSFLQKSSSSPVSCHATGFYPNRAEMFWRKDGEEIHEGVEKGEILPNNDGTFQMSVDLSSVPAEEQKYECVFQLSGASEDLVTRLEKPKIRTNEGNPMMMIIPIIVALVVLAVIFVICFILYKKKSTKRPPSPVENNEVQEQMLPTA